MQVETIRLYLEMLGYIAGIASIIYLAFEVRQGRKVNEYQSLQALEEKLTDLLWKGSENSNIDQVWLPIPRQQEILFNKALEKKSTDRWALWNAMNEQQRDCYRFTRAGLEIMEQAFWAHKNNWIDNKEVWGKWTGWMSSWKTTNFYAPYVIEEMSHWYTDSFIDYFKKLPG